MHKEIIKYNKYLHEAIEIIISEIKIKKLKVFFEFYLRDRPRPLEGLSDDDREECLNEAIVESIDALFIKVTKAYESINTSVEKSDDVLYEVKQKYKTVLGYLYRIFYYKSINWYRKKIQYTIVSLDDMPYTSTEVPDDTNEEDVLKEKIAKLTKLMENPTNDKNGLTEEEIEKVKMFWVEKLSVEEVANRLNVAIMTVKTIKYRLKIKIEGLLK